MKTKDTSHDDQATKIGEFTEWKLLAICCIFVIATWAATWFIMYRLYGHSPSDSRWISANEFGDMFGCLSCLFSGLAFAGLIVSIKQQRVDIQRQVAEMRCSQEEFQKQTILAQRQIMTTTMFSYMKNMNEKRDTLKYADDIEEVCSFLMKYFDSGQEIKPSFSRPSNDVINSFREKMERLSTWRRTLSSWFQQVDRANLSEEERKNYKIDFWHLFSRYERAASYFQVFLFSETHKKDVKQMEDLFKESVLIKYILNAQKENDDAEKRYTLLKELLAAKGEGYDKLKLPDEQIEGIINKYFPNSHINSGDYFSLLKKQQKENP